MAVEVSIIGNGKYAGAKSNIDGYSVSEEATPVEASDSRGGVGQISFNAIDDPSRFGSVLLLNDTVRLFDGDRGETQGRITALRSNNRILNVTATSRLGSLVADVVAAPVNGTLSSVMTYYLGLGGIITGIAIDTSVASIPVIAPSWTGDLWTKIKDLCVYTRTEISLIKGNVVVRPVRSRKALEINNASENWEISNVDLARNVEMIYYNSSYQTGGLVYPAGGWSDDVTILRVGAGQITSTNLRISSSPTSIVQPSASLTVPQFASNVSAYSVLGNDDLPISPATWIANGGSLTVALGLDGESLDVTLIGASGPLAALSPFRIAGSLPDGSDYSSLRVLGTGVFYDRQSTIIPTGADPATTTRNIGVTVDNIFAKSYGDAVSLASNVTGRWSSPQRTITISKADINKPGETNPNYDFATFAQFDAYAASNSITTFTQFDTAWTGKTFAQFDDYWYQLVKDDFRFQVFGNAIGARVQWRRAMYRIRSSEITEGGVQYTAEADTTLGDFDSSASGMTFSTFDTSFSGLTFNDFALIPLPNVRAEYDS